MRYREQKGFGYCYFEGVDSIEKAEQLKTKDLFIAQEDLPELEEGQYYYHELMHCTVYNEKKEKSWRSCGYFRNRSQSSTSCKIKRK